MREREERKSGTELSKAEKEFQFVSLPKKQQQRRTEKNKCTHLTQIQVFKSAAPMQRRANAQRNVYGGKQQTIKSHKNWIQINDVVDVKRW